MDNLLPNFTLPVSEPASTQTLAHFSIPNSQPPPKTPPTLSSLKQNKSSFEGVVHDLLHHSANQRLVTSSNRLENDKSGRPPTLPVTYEPSQIPGPYDSNPSSIPINDQNRGEVSPPRITKLKNKEDEELKKKKEQDKNKNVNTTSSGISFINIASQSTDPNLQQFFDAYDLYIRSGGG